MKNLRALLADRDMQILQFQKRLSSHKHQLLNAGKETTMGASRDSIYRWIKGGYVSEDSLKEVAYVLSNIPLLDGSLVKVEPEDL